MYLQLNLHDTDMENTDNDYDVDTLDFHIVPSTTSSAQEIFEALSACADLHPDAAQSDGEQDEDEEDTAPGAGGWITSENMHEFVDEDGNFVGTGGSSSEGLGAGAGTIRYREDDDEGVNGDGMEDGKWQRTG